MEVSKQVLHKASIKDSLHYLQKVKESAITLNSEQITSSQS